jgi:hypothetical protein
MSSGSLPQRWGKICKKGMEASVAGSFYRWRREGVLPVPPVGDGTPAPCRSGWTMARSPSHALGRWPVALGQCFKHGVSQKWYGSHCSPVRPTNPISYFPKLNVVCKLLKPLLCCSKIYQTLQDDRMKHSEQHSFWKEVQIPNKI